MPEKTVEPKLSVAEQVYSLLIERLNNVWDKMDFPIENREEILKNLSLEDKEKLLKQISLAKIKDYHIISATNRWIFNYKRNDK